MRTSTIKLAFATVRWPLAEGNSIKFLQLQWYHPTNNNTNTFVGWWLSTTSPRLSPSKNTAVCNFPPKRYTFTGKLLTTIKISYQILDFMAHSKTISSRTLYFRGETKLLNLLPNYFFYGTNRTKDAFIIINKFHVRNSNSIPDTPKTQLFQLFSILYA